MTRGTTIQYFGLLSMAVTRGLPGPWFMAVSPVAMGPLYGLTCVLVGVQILTQDHKQYFGKPAMSKTPSQWRGVWDTPFVGVSSRVEELSEGPR